MALYYRLAARTTVQPAISAPVAKPPAPAKRSIAFMLGCAPKKGGCVLWFLIGYPVLVATVATVFLVQHFFGLNGSEWASWAQALGSVAAVGIAIWVPYRQHEKERAREQEREVEEVQNILLGIRDELEVLVSGLREKIGNELAESPADKPFWTTWPPPTNPFVVYLSVANRIGMVPDYELRKLIIVTYSLADSFLVTFDEHNKMVERVSDLTLQDKSTGSTLRQVMQQDAEITRLAVYSNALRADYQTVMACVEQLLGKLPVPVNHSISS